MSRRRIAILMHERDNDRIARRYVVSLLAEHWREDGHEVVFLYGTGRSVAADLVLVHVDLSVVPDSYLAFANRYPVVLNGRIRDIRKSGFAADLVVQDGDGYEGPVIVKSELNYGGLPERRRIAGGRLTRAWQGLLTRAGVPWPPPWMHGPATYRVFDRYGDIPAALLGNPGHVVQKFLPERDGDTYCVRNFSFLGERTSCVLLRGRHPIVGGASAKVAGRVEPHPDIVAARERLGFDYGKFDYVVHEGRAVLLDTNKTVGCSPRLVGDEDLRTLRRFRAEGLYAFFEKG
jgi:hypothetical protein